MSSQSLDSPIRDFVIRFRIVDANAKPLEGMLPVASEKPGLLAPTMTQGTRSGKDGVSELVYPSDKWVHVRALDPAGAMMAADYLDYEPGEVPESDEPVMLKMIAAATVAATLLDENGSPVAGGSAELLMIHPAHGQWWGAESEVDASGAVQFSGLPAGVYALKVEVGDANSATFREVVLTGGQVKDLGEVRFNSVE